MIKKLIRLVFKGSSMDGLMTKFTAKAKLISEWEQAKIDTADEVIAEMKAERANAIAEKKRADVFIKNVEAMFTKE